MDPMRFGRKSGMTFTQIPHEPRLLVASVTNPDQSYVIDLAWQEEIWSKPKLKCGCIRGLDNKDCCHVREVKRLMNLVPSTHREVAEAPNKGDYILASPGLGHDTDDMAQWTQCTFTKAEVDKAGAKMVAWWKSPPDVKSPDDLGRFANIVQIWRTSHEFPLNSFQTTLRSRAKTVLIAQRLKRLSSIMNKLQLKDSMRLSQMQDLGGCRAIVSSVESVYKIAEKYGCGNLIAASDGPRIYDYIKCPKPDGYRSLHIVCRYSSSSEKHLAWDGYKIEIQLRTKLQHAFATAVETVSTFTRQTLKSGVGSEKWKRFFSLMGSVISTREGTPMVPGTPSDYSELIREVRALSEDLGVQRKLEGWKESLSLAKNPKIKQARWLLLILDLKKHEIQVKSFMNRLVANEEVAKLEQSRSGDIDAVLVWVNSFRALQRAYPNYYADTDVFLSALDQALTTE